MITKYLQKYTTFYNHLVGGFNPPDNIWKYESQLGWLFPIDGTNAPNHQPVILWSIEGACPKHLGL